MMIRFNYFFSFLFRWDRRDNRNVVDNGIRSRGSSWSPFHAKTLSPVRQTVSPDTQTVSPQVRSKTFHPFHSTGLKVMSELLNAWSSSCLLGCTQSYLNPMAFIWLRKKIIQLKMKAF